MKSDGHLKELNEPNFITQKREQKLAMFTVEKPLVTLISDQPFCVIAQCDISS